MTLMLSKVFPRDVKVKSKRLGEEPAFNAIEAAANSHRGALACVAGFGAVLAAPSPFTS